MSNIYLSFWLWHEKGVTADIHIVIRGSVIHIQRKSARFTTVIRITAEQKNTPILT